VEAVPGARYVAVDLPKQMAQVIIDPRRGSADDGRIALARTGYVPGEEMLTRG
jgi:hypothetical protein